MEQAMKKLLAIISITVLISSAAFGQAAWWEPEYPILGQSFTIYYNDIAGALPNGSDEVWLHWGVVPIGGTGWSAPPSTSWPPGSNISPDGNACQSPLTRGGDDIWFVEIDPDITIENIQFVFTDMDDNWDNNGGDNWELTFISGEEASWWMPAEPEPGDEITVFYDANAGTLPAGATGVRLHWGMNEIGSGNWIEPPASMWPAGTVPAGDGHAVQSPMDNLGGGMWSVVLPTNDTTFTIHYVVTDLTNWDNNSGANWNIILEEPPEPDYTYHTFRYDSRSRWATYNLGDINSVAAAGTYNGWSMTANPLVGPDENGVFKTEVQLPVGINDYKFVVNGSNWVQDPDNPNTDGSSYMNSRVITEADTVPYFVDVLPVDNIVLNQGDMFNISAFVRPSDFGPGIMGEPIVVIDYLEGTDTLDIFYNSQTGELGADWFISAPWNITLDFIATDSTGNTGTFTQWVDVSQIIDVYVASDARYDDIGGGDYIYPNSLDGDADLVNMVILEDAGGDELEIIIELMEFSYSTRLLMQICTETEGFFFDPAMANTETATPDWNGNGVQICIAHPLSPDYDPTIHNVLYTMRDPAATGNEIDVSINTCGPSFNLSVSDLESVLGSYNRGWYWSLCSFLDGPAGTSGHSWEVDAEHGGSDEVFDPDVFDLMFVDDRELQKIMLSNYTGNRRASLDGVGRGFALIYPEDIGPNIGSGGPILEILTRGAPTTVPEKTITGIIETAAAADITIYQSYGGGQHNYLAAAAADTFAVEITLEEGVNTIWAEAEEGGETGISPSIIFDLEVNHTPEASITVTAVGGTVTLDGSASVDPDGDDLDFWWEPDPDNPEMVTIENPTLPVVTLVAPATPGEYYVDLSLFDNTGNFSEARTLFTVYEDSVHGFDIDESVQWVRDAIIYEIFPRSYSADHQLSAITADMERIYNLGVGAIWFMPIMPGPSDHGYAIVDYYGIEEDYGTPEDFAELVEAAHSYDIKIVVDLVINHSAIEHPFMQDAITYDIYSHYYDYYDRDANGNHTYYYDWYSLPNINFDNPDVWDWLLDMCKWWVTEYDIDGYRCDVAWGVQQRNPDFWIEWRDELKKLKPEMFLLAEAAGNDFTLYDYRFDSAYDWNLHHEGNASFVNMFNGVPNLNDLHDLITNYGVSFPDYKFPFRFMENHDEERYISFNSADETKTAATLLLTIPGIPMIYAGQEIGETSQRGQINWGSDPDNMSEHYNALTQVRNLFPAVRSDDLERLYNTQYSTVYSIGRYIEGEWPVISVMNFSPGSQVVTVDIPADEWGLHPDSTYCLNEFFGNNHYWYTGSQLLSFTTSLNARTSRVYAITDSAVTLDVRDHRQIPLEYALSHSYPNPFNNECIFRFELPMQTRVNIAVFNVLGQRVRVLADENFSTGQHLLKWDGKSEQGSTLSSGMYFYRMEAGDFVKTRKMVLIR